MPAETNKRPDIIRKASHHGLTGIRSKSLGALLGSKTKITWGFAEMAPGTGERTSKNSLAVFVWYLLRKAGNEQVEEQQRCLLSSLSSSDGLEVRGKKGQKRNSQEEEEDVGSCYTQRRGRSQFWSEVAHGGQPRQLILLLGH